MLVFISIVTVGVVVVGLTRVEHARPLGSVGIAMLSFILGLSTAGLAEENALKPLQDSAPAAASVEVDESVPAVDAPAQDEAPMEDTIPKSLSESAAGLPEADAPVTDDSVPDDSGVDDSATGDAEPQELQVAPTTLTTAEMFPDRGQAPAWLERDPNTGEMGWWNDEPKAHEVYFVPIASKLQFTRTEAARALEDQKRQAINDYLNQFLNSPGASLLLNLTQDDLGQFDLVDDHFEETVVVSQGPMRQSHLLLKFDDQFRNSTMERWERIRATSRLMQTGLGAGALLLVLTTVFSYFKLDTATRGYYTGRLQFLTAATILALVVVSFTIAKWIPWM